MTDKSHVSMEQKVCPVCHDKHGTGAILMHKQLRPVFEQNTVTGFDLCPEHKKLREEGYIFLVGIDRDQSPLPLTPRTVWHLGRYTMVRKDAWSKLFKGVEVPEVMGYVDAETLDQLDKIAKEAEARG